MSLSAERLAHTGGARLAESPLGVAALLTAAAGAIHVKAAVEHAPHWWAYGAFFALLAAIQLVGALELARGREGSGVMAAAAAASLCAVGIWVVSRTVGVPFGPWAGEAEPLGVADTVATFDELCTAALLAAVMYPRRRLARRLVWVRGAQATRLASTLLAASLLALALGGHSHA